MLKEREDAYGREVFTYWEKQEGFEIVERDDGHISVSAACPASYFSEHKDWHPNEQEAMRFVRGRVLDVGCGAGRVALYLQEQGHEVTGIDISPLAIQVCKGRGVADARLLSITQVSTQMGIYDTIVMMCNNFGLFGGFARARWLLRRMRGMTSSQGRIVASGTDAYDTTNPDHLAYHVKNRERGRMSGQLRIRVRFGSYCSPWFDYLLASREEVQEIAKGTGWVVERFLGEGARYVVVMKKEGR